MWQVARDRSKGLWVHQERKTLSMMGSSQHLGLAQSRECCGEGQEDITTLLEGTMREESGQR